MNRSTLPKGWDGFAHDWAADQKSLKYVLGQGNDVDFSA